MRHLVLSCLVLAACGRVGAPEAGPSSPTIGPSVTPTATDDDYAGFYATAGFVQTWLAQDMKPFTRRLWCGGGPIPFGPDVGPAPRDPRMTGDPQLESPYGFSPPDSDWYVPIEATTRQGKRIKGEVGVQLRPRGDERFPCVEDVFVHYAPPG